MSVVLSTIACTMISVLLVKITAVGSDPDSTSIPRAVLQGAVPGAVLGAVLASFYVAFVVARERRRIARRPEPPA